MAPTKDQPAAVLVVDDNDLIRDLIVAVLRAAGFAAPAAATGREAIEQMRVHGDAVRCAVVDLSLPDMSGTQTLDRLREMAPGLPVILVSAHDEDVARKAVAERAGVIFVQKPFDAAKLADVVRDLVASAGT